MKVSVN